VTININTPTSKITLPEIILYEDNEILIVDKPAGLIVNSSNTTKDVTLQDLIYDYLKIFTRGSNADSDSDAELDVDSFYSRCGIVHRLDKATSGALVIAKDEKTFIFLQGQFKDRVVKKEYIAGIHGSLPQEVVVVDAPIERDRKRRTKFAVSRSGKPSKTQFEQITTIKIEGEDYSLLKALPESGRTHQIRVHLCAMNTPIIGDYVYSGSNRYKKIMSTGLFHRMLLHARSLGIFVPSNPDKLTFFESPVPTDFSIFYDNSSKNMK
jgi:23S rRNA pseudouridine1911/1915/1917 synthase